MRISSLASSASAAVVPNNANPIVNNRRETLMVSVPLFCLVGRFENRRVLGARSIQKVTAGVGELGLQPFHQFGDRRCIGERASAPARAPAVAARPSFLGAARSGTSLPTV